MPAEPVSPPESVPTVRVADRPAWQERAGGPWAVSWQGWLVTAPVGIVAYPLVEPGVTSASDALRWLVISTFGWLALGAVSWVAAATVLRRRAVAPASFAAVVSVGLVAGAARGLVVGLLAQAWSVSGGVTWWVRLIPGAIVGALWIVVTALMADSLARYQTRRRELVAQALDVYRERLVQSRQVEELEAQLLEGVSAQLARVRADLQSRLAADAAEGMEDVARSIRESALEAVRPLSHRLDTGPAELDLPRLRPAEVLDQIAHASGLRAWPVLLIVALINVPVLGREFGWSLAVVVVGGYSLVVEVMTMLLRSAGSRADLVSRQRYGVWLLACAGSAFLTAPIMVAIGMQTDEIVRWVVAASVCVPVMAVVVGLAAVAQPLTELSLERLEESVNREQLERWAAERELAEMRARVARFLHGTVQSRLLAASLAATIAGRTHDDGLADQARREADRALRPDLAGAARESGWLPATQVRDLADAWRGLVEVTVAVDVPDGRVPAAIVAIVEQGLADSVRHGGAETIAVAVWQADGAVLARITDDGTHSAGAAGLGSSVLDRWATAGWSRLAAVPVGTVLEAGVRTDGG